MLMTSNHRIAECNNALIYPGLGFGAILAQSRRVTDTMLLAGAQRLAALSPAIQATPSQSDLKDEGADKQYEYDGESLLPDFGAAPQVNFEVGLAVAQQAVVEGTASSGWSNGNEGVGGSADNEAKVMDEVKAKAEEKVWVPLYHEYEFDQEGLVD